MTERWKELLKKAVEMLERARLSAEDWSFGGGSALTFYYHHRESFDIDIFLTDAQHLLLLTPRLSSSQSDQIVDYTETSNFVKIKMVEGEIDFILAPHLTEKWYIAKKIIDYNIRIETPWEIIIKKLFYRPEGLKIRDVIDTAVVLKNEHNKMIEQISIIYPKLDIIEARWKKIKELYDREVKKLILLDKTIADNGKKAFDDLLSDIKKSKYR